MYSLDNVFSNNELNLFFNKYPDETYCCEAKIDGMLEILLIRMVS